MRVSFSATLLFLGAAVPAIVAQPECVRSAIDKRTDSFGNTWQIIMPFLSGNSFACQLKYGDNNSGVAALQEQLNNCYDSGLAIDGDYGTNTRNAVKHVQSLSHITQDGEYGPVTRGDMLWGAVLSDGSIGCDTLTGWGS